MSSMNQLLAARELREWETEVRYRNWKGKLVAPLIIPILRLMAGAAAEGYPAKEARPHNPEMGPIHGLLLVVLLVWIFGSAAFLALPFPVDMIAARLVLAVPIVMYVRAGAGDWRERLRLRPVPLKRLGAAFLAGGLLLLPLWTAESWLTAVMRAPARTIEAPPAGIIAAGVFIFVKAIMTPALEEGLFRGAVLRVYRQSWETRKSIIVNGLVFALFHLAPPAFIPLWIFGMIAAWLSWRDDSVLPAFAFHAGYNLTAALLVTL